MSLKSQPVVMTLDNICVVIGLDEDNPKSAAARLRREENKKISVLKSDTQDRLDRITFAPEKCVRLPLLFFPPLSAEISEKIQCSRNF